MIRQKVVCKGWVQGVGFRYRAMQAARTYGVTGWVRNDYSGSVTMELQGTMQQIENVITAIGQSAYISIDNIDRTDIPVVEGECGFMPVL